MTSTTFFIIFVPILAILLLAVNLVLAPHNPYQEKDSVFECGFHSFLGQNRTQFSVSFFIFGLLFLLFDLEILLVYPYSVSSYTNDIYGLVVMMVFFVLLTLGFIFELGKNALTIESRQTSFKDGEVSTPHAFYSSRLTSATDISEIITELDTLLPQIANFINQFNTVVSQSGVNVVTDTIGNMDLEVPKSMSDDLAKNLSNRIGVIDRLITTRGQEIRDLLQRGTDLENSLRMADSNYVSQIAGKLQEFNRLNSLYKH
jgi:NADH-ubiquinone oxidoreductase chain 3